MKATLSAACFSLLLGSLCAAAEPTPAAVTSEALRAGLVKSLAFLDKAGDTWIEEKSCNGCHHLPELLWSHREAKRRGFAIDQAKLDEWIEWANPKTKDIGAGLEQAGLMLMALPEKPPPSAVEVILKNQKADGSWNPSGQMSNMQRRDPAEVKGNSARLFLLALAASDAKPEVVEEAKKKAKGFLEDKLPPKALETLIYRCLYERKFGTPEAAEALRAEVIKQQHADGGWGYILAEPASNALGTGQALYLLGQTGGDDAAEVVRRGQQWLLAHQGQDGGWLADIRQFSKLDRSKPDKAKSLKDATMIYTDWGTSWATLGLLQGLPVVSEKQKVASKE